MYCSVLFEHHSKTISGWKSGLIFTFFLAKYRSHTASFCFFIERNKIRAIFKVSKVCAISTIWQKHCLCNCTCYLGLWGITECTVSIVVKHNIPCCKRSYLASGRAGLFRGQNLNWSLGMGPLVYGVGKISFVIEFLFELTFSVFLTLQRQKCVTALRQWLTLSCF